MLGRCFSFAPWIGDGLLFHCLSDVPWEVLARCAGVTLPDFPWHVLSLWRNCPWCRFFLDVAQKPAQESANWIWIFMSSKAESDTFWKDPPPMLGMRTLPSNNPIPVSKTSVLVHCGLLTSRRYWRYCYPQSASIHKDLRNRQDGPVPGIFVIQDREGRTK